MAESETCMTERKTWRSCVSCGSVRKAGEEIPKEKPVGKPEKKSADEYLPQDKEAGESAGIYMPSVDGDGNRKIDFDDPEKESKKPEGPEEDPEEKAEEVTCNTDKVDREIEKLKRKKARLKQQIEGEPDGEKKEDLERELEQVEAELKQKDNDTYRMQHAEFS